MSFLVKSTVKMQYVPILWYVWFLIKLKRKIVTLDLENIFNINKYSVLCNTLESTGNEECSLCQTLVSHLECKSCQQNLKVSRLSMFVILATLNSSDVNCKRIINWPMWHCNVLNHSLPRACHREGVLLSGAFCLFVLNWWYCSSFKN